MGNIGALLNAGKLAAKKAQRLQVANMTLPSAYRNFGKSVFDAGTCRDQLPELHAQADAAVAEMKTIATQAAAHPKAEGLAAKAKSVAVAAKEMAQRKALEHRLAQVFTRLGQEAFDKLGAADQPQALAEPVKAAQAQLAALDAEIAALSASRSRSILTPTRLLWAGGAAAMLLVAVLLVRSLIPEPEQSALRKADGLWDSSDRSAGIRAYMAMELDGHLDKLPRSEQAKVYARIIDGTAEMQPEVAMQYAKKARYRVGGGLLVESLAAKRILDEADKLGEAARHQAQANWDAYGQKLAAEKQAEDERRVRMAEEYLRSGAGRPSGTSGSSGFGPSRAKTGNPAADAIIRNAERGRPVSIQEAENIKRR